MSSSSSPSVQFRRSIPSQTPVTFTDASGATVPTLSTATNIHLGAEETFPKTTEAVTPSTHPSLIPLSILVVVWQTRAAGVGEYLKEARANGVPFVPLERRKFIIDWLGGEGPESVDPLPSSSSTSIDASSSSTTLPETTGPTSSALPSSSTASNLPSQQPIKRKYVVDKADVEQVAKIQAVEILLINRQTPLRSSTLTLTASTASSKDAAASGKKDYSYIRKSLFGEKLKAFKEAVNAAGGSGKAQQAASSSGGEGSGQSLGAKKPRNTTPIIVISSSPTSLITIWNAKKFFEEGIFESSKDARERMALEGITKADDVQVVIRKTIVAGRDEQKTVRYVIIDGVDGLRKLERSSGADEIWSRVACVLTTGQSWQFAQYKWSDPKQLFHHVKGVYFHWSNIAPTPAIKDWNVSALQIDPSKRHMDRALVAQFWRALDASGPAPKR
ncbi:RNA pol II accessory factor, Cdc73 family-domain-containing protein [Mrakia frigida]|uniref:Cdc73p n=1 Tax=Mrakia frigida TaxID=29902 RepID=UPI003FCBF7D2